MTPASLIKLFFSILIVAGFFESVNAEENPANFRGMVKVTSRSAQSCRSNLDDEGRRFHRIINLCTWYAAGISEDLTEPDSVGRFHLLLIPENPRPPGENRERYLEFVRVSATSRGTMTVDIPRWGLIEFFPSEVSMRDFFVNAAPASEVRSQYVTIITRVDNTLEVLIEEPDAP